MNQYWWFFHDAFYSLELQNHTSHSFSLTIVHYIQILKKKKQKEAHVEQSAKADIDSMLVLQLTKKPDWGYQNKAKQCKTKQNKTGQLLIDYLTDCSYCTNTEEQQQK